MKMEDHGSGTKVRQYLQEVGITGIRLLNNLYITLLTSLEQCVNYTLKLSETSVKIHFVADAKGSDYLWRMISGESVYLLELTVCLRVDYFCPS